MTELDHAAPLKPGRNAWPSYSTSLTGMGHVQFGGVPWQLRDLGMAECMALIPADVGEAHDPAAADATLCLPAPPA